MKLRTEVPNGYFCDGMLLYGSPERGGIASKGFRLETPDLRGASIERLNAFQDEVRGVLGLITPGRRLQVQWSCDSDYRAELRRYHAQTGETECAAAREVRNERFTRYWLRMHDRTLRRERLTLYLSIDITRYSGNVRGRDALKERYRALMAELAHEFEDFGQSLRTVLRGQTTVTPMDNFSHYAEIRKFLNPGLTKHVAEAAPIPFDPDFTIQEQCWLGDGIPQTDGGFVLDGEYHAILALARWPQRTRPGIITHLTGLPFLDYGITVNVVPAATRGEVQREEKAIERLAGEYASDRRHSLLVALRKKEKKVENLSGGFVRPFHVTYVIRTWASSREALREKVAAIQAAVHAMDGAQYYACELPISAKKLFLGSWPGWTHSSYRYRELYAEDNYLADLLPFSATFTGKLADAEALYDGSHGNLVGVSSEANGSPQHAVVNGMTGAGKSVVMHDLLMQTAGLFDYTVIIEEGLSYQRFTEALGQTPILVHPDSALTINYLDTHGMPLTQLHIASVVTLLSRMVGLPETAEQLSLRQAQLTIYVQQLYRDAFAAWSERHPDRAAEVKRTACFVQKWRDQMRGTPSLIEAYLDARERIAAGDSGAIALRDGIDFTEIEGYAADAAGSRWTVQCACARFSAQDFPTHSQLVRLLANGRLPEHPKDEIDRLATLLRTWSVDGSYGRLFDGPTTVSLQRKVAHFEMGQIPEQAVDLKAAVGLLISGFARQHILSLPRTVRKRIIFEEVGRLLDVPGGEQIVSESYAQLRKHRCWAVSIVQQYARFKQSRVRSAVIGNAKQFFFLRQSDRSDLEDLGRDLGLPESAVDAIQRYPLPEQLPANARYSSMCYYLPTSEPPQCGTIRHVEAAAPSVRTGTAA